MRRRFWRFLEKTRCAREAVTTLHTVTHIMAKMDYAQAARELSEKYALQDEMMAQQYSEYRADFTDVNGETYRRLAYDGKFPKNLSPVEQLPTPLFPITGKIYDTERRLIIPLAIRDLSNPYSKTLLSVKTSEAFKGVGEVKHSHDYSYQFAIQDPNSNIACYISKSNFEHVNILGMNVLAELDLSITMNFISNEFRLVKYNPDLYLG
ncbi:unnamed protein product [Caenorhabditis brenneri]